MTNHSTGINKNIKGAINMDNRNYRNNRRNDTRIRKNFGRGKDSVEIDMTKVKHVNEDAIKRSEQNNKIVDNIVLSSPSGRYITLGGNQSMYFTLMPTKPLIDCKYIRLLETVEIRDDAKNKKNIIYVRGCTLGKKYDEIPGICSLSNEKIAEKKCFGNKFQGASIEFLVVTGGFIQIDDIEKEFKVAFLNKNNTFLKEEFRDNLDTLKNKSLWNLYNAIKSGNVKTWTVPKPGNTLFHTMFSGEVDVEIETITGDIIKGVVKGYEFTPGGHPSLNLIMKEQGQDGQVQEKPRVVPLYTISVMLIYKYKTDDILSKRAIDLTLKGHIVIPHRGNNTIYDYCKRSKSEKEQEIKLDGTILPFDQLDKHDLEIKSIIKN